MPQPIQVLVLRGPQAPGLCSPLKSQGPAPCTPKSIMLGISGPLRVLPALSPGAGSGSRGCSQSWKEFLHPSAISMAPRSASWARRTGGTWRSWGASQAGVSFGTHGANLSHSPGVPGEPQFSLRTRGSCWSWPPLWPWGTHISLGSHLSPGSRLPKAALSALEAGKTLCTQGTPFPLGTGGTRRSGGARRAWRAQAAHVALLSFASCGTLDANITLEAAGTWEAWHTCRRKREE